MQTKDSTVDSGPSNKGILFVIVVLCAGILLFLALYLLFDWQSEPDPASYADLTAHQPTVPYEQNGFTYFVDAIQAIYFPTNKIYYRYYNALYRPDSTPVDTNLLKDAILKNQPTFELLKKGIACKSCVPPKYEYPYSGRPPEYYNARFERLRLFLSVKARFALASHQYQEAIENCIMLFHFGDRLLQYPSSYMLFLSGIQTKDESLIIMRKLICTPDLPDALFEQLAALLDQPETFSDAAVHFIRVEHGATFRAIEETYREDWLKNRGKWKFLFTTFHLKPNTTKQMLLPYYRQMISSVPLTFAEAIKIAFKNDFSAPDNVIGRYLRPNREGFSFCARAIWHRHSLSRDLATTRNNFSAARIAIAYQRYLKKEGRPPESLDDLVPTYLPAVPQDAFDGQPFRYLPKDKLLYSVGGDLKDSKAVYWTEGKSWEENRDQVYPLTPNARPKSAP